jgi:hypothetical protein
MKTQESGGMKKMANGTTSHKRRIATIIIYRM